MTAATIPSTPDLGQAEGQCRSNESGPAFIVRIHLRDIEKAARDVISRIQPGPQPLNPDANV